MSENFAGTVCGKDKKIGSFQTSPRSNKLAIMKQVDSKFLVGVDGGGSGCRVAISGMDLIPKAQVTGGPANVSTDFDGAIHNIMGAIQAAGQRLGMSAELLASTQMHLGLAGVISDEIGARVIDALPYRYIHVTDDRPTALAGALGNEDGSLLAIGTGVIAATRSRGKLRFASGWGAQISDHGSGAWLGQRLLEEMLFCCDGVKGHTSITSKTFDSFKQNAADVAYFSLQATPGEFARFAPDVVASAAAGDVIAVKLMHEGAMHLQNSLRATGFNLGDRLCLSGGLGEKYERFLTPEMLRGLVRPAGDAVSGALQLAMRAAVNG